MKSRKILSLLVSLSILGTSLFSFAPNVQAATMKNTTKNIVTKSINYQNFSVSINSSYGDIDVRINSLDGSSHNYVIETYFRNGNNRTIGTNLTSGSGAELFKTIFPNRPAIYWQSAMVFVEVDGEMVSSKVVYNLK